MKNIVIYSIFVRNHGPQGTFADVEKDLPRIAAMGVDYIWLLPVYPIGSSNRKGTFGSPYSISNYRGINPEHGTMEDFTLFVKKTHELGLKVILDIVFNHTSHDHSYLTSNPTWYTRDTNGNPVARVPAWTDIIDLKHSGSKFEKYKETAPAEASGELWDELVDVLKFWASVGVDGFRCDVAAFVPLPFWVTARREVAKINPNILWIAESYLLTFMENSIRESVWQGLPFVTVNELHQVFDITYDYETYTAWKSVLTGHLEVKTYLEILRIQATSLPAHGTKLRFVENHDKQRVMHLVKNRNEGIAWTAFSAFNSGAFLLYGGQESEAKLLPSLFELDKIEWGTYSLQQVLTKLIEIKHSIPSNSLLTYLAHTPAIVACWESPQDKKGALGIFNVKGESGEIKIMIRDGKYVNAMTKEEVEIKGGKVPLPDDFAILWYKVGDIVPVRPFPSYIL